MLHIFLPAPLLHTTWFLTMQSLTKVAQASLLWEKQLETTQNDGLGPRQHHCLSPNLLLLNDELSVQMQTSGLTDAHHKVYEF